MGPASSGPTCAGIPAIEGCIACVACELRDVIAGGDHVIVTGDVRRVRRRGRAAESSTAASTGRSKLSRTGVDQKAQLPAARSARKKITMQLTAMIPVSRRTMASAMRLLAVLGQGLEVEVADLLLGGAGAGGLGEQGDRQRQEAVEVVEVVGGLVAGEDEHAAEQDLDEDRDLGGAQHVPEVDRGPVAQPGDAAHQPRGEVENEHRDPGHEVHLSHAPSLRRMSGGVVRRRRNPPGGRVFRLADAENHYVASCYKVGI